MTQEIMKVPAQPQPLPCQPQSCRAQPGDMDFDISRTYLMLTVTLVLPIYLALSVVSFSMAALIV
jgi:hypothetical protein